MPHIHTESGHHDHTVSFHIIRTDGDEPRLMMHKHKKFGKLTMFGGHIELNETPWQAVLHEVVEESGYDHSQLTVLQPTQTPPLKLSGAVVHPLPVCHTTGTYPCPTLHYHTDTMYALVASSDPAGEPDEGESTDIRLLTLEELNSIPDDEIVEAWRQVGRHILTNIHGKWFPYPLSDFEG